MEPPAEDPYEQGREGLGPEGQRQEHSTKDTYDRLQQFLHHDRKVLRYFAHSETPFTPIGKTYKKKYIICFFLSDNSLEVRDVRDASESKGAGTFPKFLKRQRLPKTRTGTADSFPSMGAATDQAYFSPEDFAIGQTVEILRQQFFVYDMDEFTRQFHSSVLGQATVEPVPVERLPPPVVPLQVGASEPRLR